MRDTDYVIRRLLEINLKKSKALNKIQKDFDKDPATKALRIDILDLDTLDEVELALDLAGVPVDNSPCFEHLSLNTDVHNIDHPHYADDPVDYFCRDAHMDLHELMVLKHEDIDGFIEVIKSGKVPMKYWWQLSTEVQERGIYGYKPDEL